MKIKISTYILIFLIAIDIYVVFPVKALNPERHSKIVGDMIYNEIYFYKSFIEWLKESRFLSLNISEDNLALIDKEIALDILNKVFNDSKIAMFTGGIQLRMLKKYAGLKQFVNESDIVNLIKAIIKDSNITLINSHCDHILAKFLIHITYISNSTSDKKIECRWSTDDLELYAKYLLSLKGFNLNMSEGVINIIKYLYILRMATISGSIDRKVLSSIIGDLSSKYSIITAIFIKTYVYGYNLKIVDRGLDRKVSIEGYTQTHIPIMKTNVSDVREYNLTYVLIKALQTVEKLKENGIDIKYVDIFKFVDTLMNVNVNEYHNIIANINNFLNNEYIETTTSNINNYSYANRLYSYNDYYITNRQTFYYYADFWYGYEDAVESSWNNNDKSKESLINLHSLPNESVIDALNRSISSELFKRDILNEIIEHTNKNNIETIDIRDSILVSSTRQIATRRTNYLNNTFYTLIIIVILVVFSLYILTVFMNTKIKPFLKQLIKIPKEKSKGDALQAESKNIKIKLFIEFWNTIHRLANEFNLKIEGSYTHREIKHKLITLLDVESSRKLIERITYLYEILRYSNIEDINLLDELSETLNSIKIKFHSIIGR
uniref:DUF4129 domain-containing protein n=1 Tax=Ignisphaera aggregans TaxID=334771 RepID=A0A7C5UY05_9CREN